MAIGDGSTWDETLPSDVTTAIQIDDYNRDLRVGISARMRFEHEWPASQSATSEGGKHKFITFQTNAAKPTLAGTQVAAIYTKTDDNLYFEKSAGTEVTIVSGTAVGDGKALMSATDTAAGYLIDKIDGITITASGTGLRSVVLATTSYDSGWFAVSKGTSVTKTHGLGTIKLITSLLYSPDATGLTFVAVVGQTFQHEGGTTDSMGGILDSISTSTLRAVPGDASVIVGSQSGNGAFSYKTNNGYYRVLAVALA